MNASLPLGPFDWEASATFSNNGSFHAYVVDANRRKIAAIWGKQQEKAATAWLFSAAPDLLNALEIIHDANEDCRKDGNPTFIPDPIDWLVKAALAKARGEKP
jgi:hypothetical protein